jgi:putative endonuclease
MYFVYIIYSDKSEIYYRGYSENPTRRLEQHNNNESRYTSNKGPWELVYLESKETKKDALIREKALKKYSKQQIRELIQSAKNEF